MLHVFDVRDRETVAGPIAVGYAETRYGAQEQIQDEANEGSATDEDGRLKADLGIGRMKAGSVEGVSYLGPIDDARKELKEIVASDSVESVHFSPEVPEGKREDVMTVVQSAVGDRDE